MSKISLAPDVSGTGIFTIASPNSNTNRTLTLPDDTGTIVTNSGNQAGSFTTLNTSGAVVFNDAGADVDFRVEGDTEPNLLFVDASTNRVGIGTNAPTYPLAVSGSSQSTIEIKNTSGTGEGRLYFSDDSVTAIGGIEYHHNGDFMRFYTNNAERARITSDGKFLLGNTDGPFLITVGSNKQAGGLQASAVTSGTTGVWTVGNTSGGSCQIQADFISSAGTAVLATDSGTANGFYFRTYDGGYDYRFRIAASGSVTNSTGSYGTISDARTKTVVGNASLQWNDIKQLNFVKYKLNKNIEFEQSEENEGGYVAPTMLGLVAQEVEQICPGLIEESADPEFGQVKVIKTSILYMKAVKALQEAMERIETLEASNTALEARIAALETGA